MVAVPRPVADSHPGPSRTAQHGTTPRNITEPVSSAAAAALSSHLTAPANLTAQANGTIDFDTLSNKRPRLAASKTSHARVSSWPAPPPVTTSTPSAPAVPTRASLDPAEPLFPRDRTTLVLYTYRPSNNSTGISQPSPLPSSSSSPAVPHSMVQFAHDALPWKVRPGEYLQMRRIERIDSLHQSTSRTRGMGGAGPMAIAKSGGEALRHLGKGRDAYIFRAGEDISTIPINQIHLPESVAAAFRFQHRNEVEIIRVST